MPNIRILEPYVDLSRQHLRIQHSLATGDTVQAIRRRMVKESTSSTVVEITSLLGSGGFSEDMIAFTDPVLNLLCGPVAFFGPVAFKERRSLDQYELMEAEVRKEIAQPLSISLWHLYELLTNHYDAILRPYLGRKK